jgi:hypothetical protein
MSNFPPRLKVNTECFRIKYVSGYSALLADAEVNNPDEPKTFYISIEEHQAIISELERKLEKAKDSLVVLAIEINRLKIQAEQDADPYVKGLGHATDWQSLFHLERQARIDNIEKAISAVKAMGDWPSEADIEGTK